MKEDLKVSLSPDVEWEGLDFGTPLEKIPCTCGQDSVTACIKILPTAPNSKPVIVYNSCARAIWAAMKRQCRDVPTPDPEMLSDFKTYLERHWYPIFDDVASILKYNWADFYNHLSAKKQKLLDKIDWNDPRALSKYEFHIFCKREKQVVNSWLKLPKNRAISAPNEEAKGVLGPVIWALEYIIGDLVPGYSHPDKNWGQMEKQLAEYYKEGFIYKVSGDGSAFDTTQSYDVKNLVEFELYRRIVKAGKIHHVSPDIFLRTATRKKRMLICDARTQDGKLITLARGNVTGRVFSGTNDTTFGNTLRMALYQHYVMHLAGYRRNEYKVWAKGDDFVVFLKEVKPNVSDAYYKVFTKSLPNVSDQKAMIHGLGMVLKMLDFGKIEDMDFCSTHVIRDDETFKIVRQVDRMMPLSHYSVKAKSFTPTEMHYYLKAQADSIRAWAGDMPYFGDYAKAFDFHAAKITPNKLHTFSGEGRKRLDAEFNTRSVDTKYLDLGYDFHYGWNLRQSETKVSKEAVYDFLLTKYGLSKIDIDAHAELLLKDSMIFDNISRHGLISGIPEA
jgi:hypothetical protein